MCLLPLQGSLHPDHRAQVQGATLWILTAELLSAHHSPLEDPANIAGRYTYAHTLAALPQFGT